jgi:phage repressor protein C with HTH and peptisase S24 domain
MHKAAMDTEWLKNRKKALGLTDASLAEAFGVERSVANKIVNGKVPLNARRADAVAELLGESRDEVLYRAGISSSPPVVDQAFGQGKRTAASYAPPSPEKPAAATADTGDAIEMVDIQHIDMAYGLGTTFAVDYPDIDVLQFPKAWIQTITHAPPSTLTWTRGKGDSMEPTIRDGDLILLDRSQRVLGERDAMWAFTIGEEAAIKRLRRQGDACEILSDNASIPPDRQMLRDINIVGRVVFVGSRK